MDQGGTFLYFRPWYKKSPYFEATQRAGCESYELYNHMYLPGYYSSFEDEYWHLVNHVALWDVAVERGVEITGPDAHRFTNALTCRAPTRCGSGPAQGQGPKSRDVMRALFGDRIEGVRYYWTLQTDLDGIPVVISRTGWTAELGVGIYLRGA